MLIVAEEDGKDNMRFTTIIIVRNQRLAVMVIAGIACKATRSSHHKNAAN